MICIIEQILTPMKRGVFTNSLAQRAGFEKFKKDAVKRLQQKLAGGKVEAKKMVEKYV